MNDFSNRGIPFLFIIDFDAECPLIYPLDKVPDEVRISTPRYPDVFENENTTPISLQKEPRSLEDYTLKFNQVKKEIIHGNSFLVNLTQPTKIICNWSLEDIYHNSRAKHKLLIKNKFVTFSPETFIRIENGKISTYPMKGTIDAAIPNAESIIIDDEKESSEHYTIVDLMRNDLSQISQNVQVEEFRYIDRIHTHEKEILQVSSKITGDLHPDYHRNIGEIIFKLLPAGSITGAPKSKTVEILKEIEGYKRGYYTGVFGTFDGTTLDSAVMIRYIEQTNQGLLYKSGGGITHRSNAEQEYNELIDKIYVPLA